MALICWHSAFDRLDDLNCGNFGIDWKSCEDGGGAVADTSLIQPANYVAYWQWRAYSSPHDTVWLSDLGVDTIGRLPLSRPGRMHVRPNSTHTADSALHCGGAAFQSEAGMVAQSEAFVSLAGLAVVSRLHMH